MKQNSDFQVVGYIGLPRAEELPSGVFPLLVDKAGRYYTVPEAGRADPKLVEVEEIKQALAIGTATDCRHQSRHKVGCFSQGPVPYQAGHYLILLDPEVPEEPPLPEYLDETKLGDKLGPLALRYLQNGLTAYRNEQMKDARRWWYKAGRALSRIALPELLSYASYWTEEDGDGIQVVAERLQETYRSSFPPPWPKRDIHSSHITIQLRRGKVIWEGLLDDSYSLTPELPIESWEFKVFSQMLKLLDEAELKLDTILRPAAVVVQSRLWLGRLCDERIRPTVWSLLNEGPSREISLHLPAEWTSREDIPKGFSPWITQETLGDDPANALAVLLPLGAIVFAPKELRLLVTRNDKMPDPGLVTNMLTPLLEYCPWSIDLRSYLATCLGNLSLRVNEAATECQEKGNLDEARKLWAAALVCYRIMVDKADLNSSQLGDLSRAAVTLSKLGNHRKAVPYAERFVQEWEKRGCEHGARPSRITEQDWWSLAADAFRIYGLALCRWGKQAGALKSLQTALQYYEKVPKFAQRQITCLLGLAGLDPDRRLQYLQYARALADRESKPFEKAQVAYDLYRATRAQEYLDSAITYAKEATDKNPHLPKGWLLRIILLLEADPYFETIRALYDDACHKVKAPGLQWFHFMYGVLLEEEFPSEAVNYWLKLIQGSEHANVSLANRLVQLAKREPGLDMQLIDRLPTPSEDSSLGVQWIWAHLAPDQVGLGVFDQFRSQVSSLSRIQLETLAEFCTDRAAEEPPGSNERERWCELAIAFNSRLEDLPATQWDIVVRTRRVRLELLRDAVDDAARILNSFPKESQHDPYVRFYRAEVAFRQEKFGEALQILEDLVREGGTDPRIDQLDRLYRVCMRLGDRDRAEKVLERILELRPDDPRALVALGHFKFGAGDVSGAADAYADAVQAHITAAEEAGDWTARREQSFSITIRSLVSLARDNEAVREVAEKLIESGNPEIMVSFAKQLMLVGEFNPVWSKTLRSTRSQVSTRRATRAVAQYFMGRAIALRLGLVHDTTFTEWVGTVHGEFQHDPGLLAEFAAGAKGTYLRCLRRLAERLVIDRTDKSLGTLLAGLLEGPTSPCPKGWESLLRSVTQTIGSPTYYREVQSQLFKLNYGDQEQFLRYIEAQVSILVRQEANKIRLELERFLEKTDASSHAAAVDIASKVFAVRSLWLPASVFGGSAIVDGGNGHTPIWVDQGALHIASIRILGSKEIPVPPEWKLLSDGSYSCILKGTRIKPNQQGLEAVQRLLALQTIRLHPKDGGWQFAFSPSASAIDITG